MAALGQFSWLHSANSRDCFLIAFSFPNQSCICSPTPRRTSCCRTTWLVTVGLLLFLLLLFLLYCCCYLLCRRRSKKCSLEPWNSASMALPFPWKPNICFVLLKSVFMNLWIRPNIFFHTIYLVSFRSCPVILIENAYDESSSVVTTLKINYVFMTYTLVIQS